MTIGEAVNKAIDERDGQLAVRITDILRFKYKMNFAQSFALVKKIRPTMTLAAWDELLFEGDQEVP